MVDWSPKVINYGTMHTGKGDIIGSAGAVIQSDPMAATSKSRGRWDIGVITVVTAEMQAVSDMLDHLGECRENFYDGRRFVEVQIGAEQTRLVATQALNMGQHSAISTFHSLQRHYSPAVVALVGIAGGIGTEVALGDVVIGQEIVYYELRKETAEGIHRRAQVQQVPAIVLHRINDYFAARKECDGTFHLHRGPIGSGEALIANNKAEIIDYLKRHSYKVLALEMEAGGLAQAFYEEVPGDTSVRGWLAIRGISDFADAKKNDDFREIASRNAATVLEGLLPHLRRVSM
jgi:adenosylhomocysteine nucleosidase